MDHAEGEPSHDAGAVITQAWQPIETAPRDGTEVLVACPFDDGSYEMSVASWWVKSWAARGRDNDVRLPMLILDRQPTHWMRLPADPETPR
jgi:hypothetical protein